MWLLLAHVTSGRRPFAAAFAVLSTTAPHAAAASLATPGWEATRQQRLDRMAAEAETKAALCAGRTAAEIPDLSVFDMTFDPPCYISGYYELIAIGAILGVLKVGQAAQEPPAEGRGAQDRLRMQLDRSNPVLMQLQWPGAGGGDSDFFPEGDDPDEFDSGKGPLRLQILRNANFFQGTLGGYSKLRPAMKRAFAGVSKDGTDNGWIDSAAEFEKLMKSVGASAKGAS